MKHILLIDAGNSCAKWKLLGVEGEVQGVLPYDESPQQIIQWQALSIDAIWIAEVGSSGLTAQLKHSFAEGSVHSVISEERCLGVTNQYAEPWRLGVDRLLAMVESYYVSGEQACAVLDVGTAATFDVVSADGVHLGGHIVPGLMMLRDSLLQNTQQVRVRDDEQKTQLTAELGVGTANAVLNGSWAMLLGWIKQELAAFHQAYPDAPVYLAGGLADQVNQQLSEKLIIHKHLVLDALERLAAQT